jgi:hypothetical protein
MLRDNLPAFLIQQPKQTSFFKLKRKSFKENIFENKEHTFGTLTGIPKLFEFEDVFILKRSSNYNLN